MSDDAPLTSHAETPAAPEPAGPEVADDAVVGDAVEPAGPEVADDAVPGEAVEPAGEAVAAGAGPVDDRAAEVGSLPAPVTSEAEHLRAIESIVLVAREPVPPDLLAQLLERSVADVERWCRELAAGYEAEGRGFQLVRVAGGYRYQTHPDLTPYVERFLLHDQRARLSGAALETLAIVAYKQPISRAQIASIRGVDPDGVLRTLQGRGYIDVVGRDNGPGQAVLYGTTPTFLEKLGLNSIEDLPPIAEFIPGADVVEALEAGLRVTDAPAQ